MKKIKFLDMRIQDTGNSDGVTLVINDCSAGNFGTNWESAKLWAIRMFMIRRPDDFGAAIAYRLSNHNRGAYMEWFTFKKVCDREGIEIPEGLGPSEDCNFLITYNGNRV